LLRLNKPIIWQKWRNTL